MSCDFYLFNFSNAEIKKGIVEIVHQFLINPFVKPFLISPKVKSKR